MRRTVKRHLGATSREVGRSGSKEGRAEEEENSSRMQKTGAWNSGKSFSSGRAPHLLLLYTPTLVGKLGAGLQRLWGRRPMPIYKLGDGNPHALTPNAPPPAFPPQVAKPPETLYRTF